MSVELWKTVFDWATVVLVALTVVSGAGALITGNIISKQQEAKSREFEGQLTEANVELEKQRIEAANAEATQQRIELELSKQREKTAKAERATLELRQKIEPRELSEEQRKTLATALAKIPRIPVTIQCMLGDREGCPFAEQIMGVFESSGWKVSGVVQAGYPGNPTGILVTIHAPHNGPFTENDVPPLVREVQYAFFSAGLESHLGFLERVPANSMEILVGGKL